MFRVGLQGRELDFTSIHPRSLILSLQRTAQSIGQPRIKISTFIPGIISLRIIFKNQVKVSLQRLAYLTREDLNPYHVQRVRSLTAGDYQQRLDWADWF